MGSGVTLPVTYSSRARLRAQRGATEVLSHECALRQKQARRSQSENGGRIAAAVGAPFRQVVEERREHGARELA